MTNDFLIAYATSHGLATAEDAEREVVRILYAVAKDVGPKFRFGYLDLDDAIQQAVLYGLLAIESGSYDVTKPLENFMRHHMRNRMFNYKRDTFSRIESPCVCCDVEYPPTSPCELFQKWFKRNQDKKSLTSANSGGIEYETYVDASVSETEFAEIIGKIDDVLPMEYRADYLRMRDGITISKARRNRIREFLKGVFTDGETENS